VYVNGRVTGGGTGRESMQSEDETFSAVSDSPEEDDDDADEYLQTLSPGYAVAAATKSVCDYDTGDDDFPYEVLTADELVQHMVDCIKDVNTVVQVCCSATSTRLCVSNQSSLWLSTPLL